MLKDDLNSVREVLLTVTNQASAEGSGVIRAACQELRDIADQVGCLEAHFMTEQQEDQEGVTV